VGKVAILPDAVADQIAAGEVVERPASVVKELVENALDAGASTITVELDEGGRTSIRVSDDGHGMEKDDAILCVDRHATSKIRSAADLVGVATYGFRGEALAAIASVSKFDLETSAGGDGTLVRVNGGRLDAADTVARQRGTSVTVKRLFYNTPARRKFLRAGRSETRASLEALTVLALARLDVTFRLESDGRVLLDAPRVSSVVERIASLFSEELAASLIPVDFALNHVSVRGFVQRPADTAPSGRKAFLFVNGRPFRDGFLLRAAEMGYRGAMHPGTRPSLLLTLGVPGDRVDVNVHPAKLEVRFQDRMLVERAVEEAVRAALAPMGASAQWSGARRPDSAPGAGAGGWGGGAALIDVAAGDMATPPSVAAADAPLFSDAGIALEAERPAILAQLFSTYLLLESPDGLAIVDQHSAHERILYERAMAELASGSGASQHLLLPLTVDLAPGELDAVETHGDLLNAVGYAVEPFGGRSVVIHAVPNPHRRFDARRCFEELVADLAKNRFGGLHNKLERFAATYACRGAVKAGDVLEPAEQRELIRRLFACTLPPHDVHGRPTIVQLPRAELERRFGRA
jgi:DNA mismatch repair protein MutL